MVTKDENSIRNEFLFDQKEKAYSGGSLNSGDKVVWNEKYVKWLEKRITQQNVVAQEVFLKHFLEYLVTIDHFDYNKMSHEDLIAGFKSKFSDIRIYSKANPRPTTNPSNESSQNKTASGHVLKFNISQVVYLKTDTDQSPRIVTGIQLRPSSAITYGVSSGAEETWHYDIELSDERDVILATSN